MADTAKSALGEFKDATTTTKHVIITHQKAAATAPIVDTFLPDFVELDKHYRPLLSEHKGENTHTHHWYYLYEFVREAAKCMATTNTPGKKQTGLEVFHDNWNFRQNDVDLWINDDNKVNCARDVETYMGEAVRGKLLTAIRQAITKLRAAGGRASEEPLTAIMRYPDLTSHFQTVVLTEVMFITSNLADQRGITNATLRMLSARADNAIGYLAYVKPYWRTKNHDDVAYDDDEPDHPENATIVWLARD